MALVRKNWAAVERVARALARRHELGERDLFRLAGKLVPAEGFKEREAAWWRGYIKLSTQRNAA